MWTLDSRHRSLLSGKLPLQFTERPNVLELCKLGRATPPRGRDPANSGASRRLATPKAWAFADFTLTFGVDSVTKAGGVK